jgi:hypothetical protein
MTSARFHDETVPAPSAYRITMISSSARETSPPKLYAGMKGLRASCKFIIFDGK